MIRITRSGAYCRSGAFLSEEEGRAAGLPAPAKAREGTMAYGDRKSVV